MKRLIMASLVLVFLVPAVALAGPVTQQHRRQYQRDYARVVAKFGHRAPGRNIVRDGLSSGAVLADADVVRSLAVLERMLAPPPAPVQSVASPVASTVYTVPSTTYSAGASGVPACASESGTNYSTGPSNTNASSGATGRYQIIPSTASAYGCDLSTPAGQDACAATIYAHQGSGAWVGCGG